MVPARLLDINPSRPTSTSMLRNRGEVPTPNGCFTTWRNRYGSPAFSYSRSCPVSLMTCWPCSVSTPRTPPSGHSRPRHTVRMQITVKVFREESFSHLYSQRNNAPFFGNDLITRIDMGPMTLDEMEHLNNSLHHFSKKRLINSFFLFSFCSSTVKLRHSVSTAVRSTLGEVCHSPL